MEMSSTNLATNDLETAALLSRQSLLVSALRPVLPEHALLWEPEDTIPYECDGLAIRSDRILDEEEYRQ